MERVLSREEISNSITNSPFHRFLGLELADTTDESLTLKLSFKDSFIAGDKVDYIHGGILASIIDVAGYFVLFQVLNIPAPTLDLHINYLRAAKKKTYMRKQLLLN